MKIEWTPEYSDAEETPPEDSIIILVVSNNASEREILARRLQEEEEYGGKRFWVYRTDNLQDTEYLLERYRPAVAVVDYPFMKTHLSGGSSRDAVFHLLLQLGLMDIATIMRIASKDVINEVEALGDWKAISGYVTDGRDEIDNIVTTIMICLGDSSYMSDDITLLDDGGNNSGSS